MSEEDWGLSINNVTIDRNGIVRLNLKSKEVRKKVAQVAEKFKVVKTVKQ